jgi:hypothetical protein
VQRDLNAAWAAIGTATVDDAARLASWANWANYTAQAHIDPYLRYLPRALKQTYLLAFAARVCTGIFGHAVQVGAQSVEKAIVTWRKPSFWPDSTTPDKRMDPKN